jgi:hypothetical protein
LITVSYHLFGRVRTPGGTMAPLLAAATISGWRRNVIVIYGVIDTQ